jgi:hypothetical protein
MPDGKYPAELPPNPGYAQAPRPHIRATIGLRSDRNYGISDNHPEHARRNELPSIRGYAQPLNPTRATITCIIERGELPKKRGSYRASSKMVYRSNGQVTQPYNATRKADAVLSTFWSRISDEKYVPELPSNPTSHGLLASAQTAITPSERTLRMPDDKYPAALPSNPKAREAQIWAIG